MWYWSSLERYQQWSQGRSLEGIQQILHSLILNWCFHQCSRHMHLSWFHRRVHSLLCWFEYLSYRLLKLLQETITWIDRWVQVQVQFQLGRDLIHKLKQPYLFHFHIQTCRADMRSTWGQTNCLVHRLSKSLILDTQGLERSSMFLSHQTHSDRSCANHQCKVSCISSYL